MSIENAKTDQRRVDEKDRRIVEYLIQDPQATIQLIATKLGYPPSTVQKRLQKLIQNEQLGRGLYVRDWVAAGFPLKSRIDLKVNKIALAKGNSGPPENARTSTDVTDGVPQLPPPPSRRIFTQAQLARYIKHELSVLYQGSLVVESVAVLFGGGADLSVTVHATHQQVVWDFVLNALGVLQAVEGSTTAEEAYTY